VEKAGEVTLLSNFVSTVPDLSASVVNGEALVRYYGIQAKDLPFPAATSANLTIDKFFPLEGSVANVSYTADVEGMSAGLECETLNLPNVTDRTSLPWISILAPFFSINITTPSCNISGVPMGMGTDHNPPHTDITSSYQGWWSNYTCNDGLQNDQYPAGRRGMYKPIIPGFDDHRLVMINTLVQWTPDDSGNTTRVTWVQNFTAIMCKPRYSIDTYSVSLSQQQADQREPFSAVKRSGKSRKIDGFTDDDLVPLLKTTAGQSRLLDKALRGVVAEVSSDSGYVRPQDPYFILLSRMSGDSGMAALMNQTTLLEVASQAFSGAMAQMFHDYFTTPSEQKIPGRIRSWENKLRISVIPVILMTTILVLMTCIALGMVYLRPKHAVPLDPQSISAKAKLLAASQALSQELLGVNGQSDNTIQRQLKGRVYQSISTIKENNKSFTIGTNLYNHSPVAGQEKAATQAKARWQPMSQKIWFALVIVLLPLAVIGILEGLQHASNSDQGLLDFTASGNRHIFITLIPAAVMTGTALLFSALHFGTSLMAPFHALNRGGVPLSNGLTASLEGKSCPHSLYLALKHRFILPCFSVTAVLVASFLTIVVSGLYFVEDVPLMRPIQMQQTDSFNHTRNDLSKSDNLASVVTNLIYYQNLSYPPWTYNNLVFPTLSLIGPIDAAQNHSSLIIQIPAVRPTLDCLTVSPDDMSYQNRISFEDYPNPGLPPGVQSRYNATLDMPCSVNGTTMGCDFDFHFSTYVPVEGSEVLTGTVLTTTYLSCGATPRGLDLPEGEDQYPLADGCPGLLYALGTTSTKLSNDTSFTQGKPEIYGFLCNQHLEEVETSVTFNMPDLSISADSPPVPLEETAKKLNFTHGNYTGPVYPNSLETLVDALPGNNSEIGRFMDAVIRGKGGIDVNTLLGEEGIPSLMKAVQDLYATYMVQAIDANFRIPPADSSQDPTTYGGILLQPHRQRLKQDPNTKWVLQAMLGFMALCAIVVFLFSDREAMLPCSPCSIAGTMVLLAGSEMTSRRMVLEGSEWDARSDMWEGWLFSLGWWGDVVEKRRFGIDVGRAERGCDVLVPGDGGNG
jgi:Protein of unknown function (DUF3433)